MRDETMTPEERIMCAINLEKPDRVPVCPLLNTSAAAALTGLSYEEVVNQGVVAQQEAEIKLFDEFGGWDGTLPALTPEVYTLGGLKTRKPTEESPEVQILEEEFTKYEDYDLIIEGGWGSYVREHLIFRVSDLETVDDVSNLRSELVKGFIKAYTEYGKRGAFMIMPTLNTHPFFRLSLSRSMVKFTEDLYYRPELVERALEIMTTEFIKQSLAICKRTNSKIMGLVEERAGGFFYPMKIFERFWWPHTLKITDALWSEGIITWFHLDTCWDKNISYFKELPRASAVIDLDGTTDIFAAGEQLADHLCINSDVHPALMSLGKPEEVEAYCKKLIDELGKDGGLLLSTGCGLPAAARKENFVAMLETGKTYELSEV